MGEMSAEIAHEIKNSLAVIKSSASLIKDLSKDDPKYDFKIDHLTSKIDETSSSIANIVKGLQSMSYDGEGDPLVEVELSSLFQEVFALFRKRAIDLSVDLSMTAGEDIHLVLGRHVQIYQVLFNLVKNSLDAIEGMDGNWSNKQHKVEVLTEDAGGKVLIRVNDSGPGIPRKIASKIFEPFFTTKEKGKGLGLSICSKIVKEHEGDIFVDLSHKSTSVCFTLRKFSIIKASKIA